MTDYEEDDLFDVEYDSLRSRYQNINFPRVGQRTPHFAQHENVEATRWHTDATATPSRYESTSASGSTNF